MKGTEQKVLVNVAPVVAMDKVIIPKKVAEDVHECYKAGAAVVHLHVRDREGNLTKGMTLLEEILVMIRRDSDIVIEVPTGGVSDLTTEEWCALLYPDLVEACSLNVGSANLGKAVYYNPMDDVEHCVREMLKQKKTPEVEAFEVGHTWVMTQLMKKYEFADPVLFSVALGHEGEASATSQALAAMIQMIPVGTIWGITQANRRDSSPLAGAVGMGAKTARIGSEDSNYLNAVTQANTNAPLVVKTVRMLRATDKEPMAPGETREFLDIGRQEIYTGEERKTNMPDADVLKQYSQIDCGAVQALLETRCREDRHEIVVLDDDPTGAQTAHGISMYTDWSYESVKRGFEEEGKLFYIPTNSRGLTVEQTTRAHVEIGGTVMKVSEETGIDYAIVSRGDSTLRGYYPLETELPAWAEESYRGKPMNGEIICPYSREGDCLTIDSIHCVEYGEQLVSAGETEFAGDKTSGHHSSDPRKYVEEKTEGRHRAADVLSVSLKELHSLDYDGITQKLLSLRDSGKIVVNVVDACNLKVFCIALYNAMDHGHRFMLRAAAGFVKEFGVVSDRPLFTRDEMVEEDWKIGGIIVVGSHTKKTTIQLEALRQAPGIEMIELNSDLVLDEAKFQEEINTVLMYEKELLGQDVTAVVYIKRELLSLESDSPEATFLRSIRMSDAVQSLVGRLKVTPAFVVAKGRITSSDAGTEAPKARQVTVLGQIRSRVPVWKTGPESRFPDAPYVTFPGDVGEAEALREAMEELMGRQ